MARKGLSDRLSIDYWEKKWQKKPRSKLRNAVLVLFETLKAFIADNGFEKAATLTFYSLLSLIPLLAIGFGIAQTLGYGKVFLAQIELQLRTQPEIAAKFKEFAKNAFERTRGGLLASLALVILLWTVLRMIGNIENYFNQIWKAKTPRTFFERVKAYIPLIVLFPIILVLANSALIFLRTNVPLPLNVLLHFFPYLIIAVLSIFIFKYLPHTPVSFKAATIGGIFTAIAYHLWQLVYVWIQIHVTSYGVIYGSFAAIPLFLLWLNTSWTIVFLGCELAYQVDKH